MEYEDSRSDGEVSDSQGPMSVHLVDEDSHTVDCPLGRSDFLIFYINLQEEMKLDLQKVLWQESLADKTAFCILKCTCVPH